MPHGEIERATFGNSVGIDANGNLAITGAAVAGGGSLFTLTPGAHTAVVAEVKDFNLASHTMTITGAYATQRFTVFDIPTISAATSLTVTTAATVAIVGAPAATGAGPAAITTALALWVQARLTKLDGGLTVTGSTTVGNVTLNNNTGIAFNTSTGSKIGTAANQKIGFWNATAIVQPASTANSTATTAAGSTTTVFVNTTFTGGVGATAYSIADIIANLKNAGILAQ